LLAQAPGVTSPNATLPPPTEAYLKLTEKCKAAKQMRK
jgi:hypothetical protein